MLTLLSAIVVNLTNKTLCTIPVQDNVQGKCYPVAIGRKEYPTPVGEYKVKKIILNPELVSFRDGRAVPGNVLGTIAITLGENTNIPGSILAIHGTNQPEKIGLAISHGCVRMVNEDVEELVFNYSFETVKITN